MLFHKKGECIIQGFKDAYLSVYEPVMLQMGFVKKGVIFHRLVNGEIIQIFSYKKFSHSFTMQFCICPLCAGCEFTTFIDETRLGSLLGNETYAEWDSDGTDYIKQMLEALTVCNEYLFPCFERVYDYASYFDYVIDSHKKMCENLNEDYKKAYADLISVPQSAGFYEVCLKLGNYAVAKQLQEKNLKQADSAIKRNRECNIEPTSEQLDRNERRRNEYRLMRNAMDSNDRDFIESYIARRAEYSYQSYLKNFAYNKG